MIDVTRLRVAIARLSRRLRRHELAGLTPTQLAALSTVERAGPLRLGDLAAAEGIAPSTLTRLVTVLEEAGYVTPAARPERRPRQHHRHHGAGQRDDGAAAGGEHRPALAATCCCSPRSSARPGGGAAVTGTAGRTRSPPRARPGLARGRPLEQERRQAGAGLLHPVVAGREDLEQLDQVDARLVTGIARGPLDHAEQAVEGLLGPAGGDLDVGDQDLRLGVVGARRPPSRLAVAGSYPTPGASG